MVNVLDRTFAHSDYAAVRTAYISRTRLEKQRIADFDEWMIDRGFERIDATGITDEKVLTDDGREILRAHGRFWALRPDVHAKRLAEAVEQARQRDTIMAEQQQQLSHCRALIDGQLCGGTLVRAAVCPRCALGKSGVAATLTCDVCGQTHAVMRDGQ